MAPAIVFIALGANLGDRRATMREAVRLLSDRLMIRSERSFVVASLYETTPIGGPPGQPEYLNSVVRFETALRPRDLLEVLHSIETRLGRVRSQLCGPRTIDLDILLYGGEIIDEPRLIIPHPRLHERCFVLAPFGEIAPAVLHPVLNERIDVLERRARAANRRDRVVRIEGSAWALRTPSPSAIAPCDEGDGENKR